MQTKETKRKKYSAEFKLTVILDMRDNHLGYRETMRKYSISGCHTVQSWERIYLEEGKEGLMKNRKGRPKADNSKVGRPLKLDKPIEEDLIAENQRLRMENEYLKKLIALVQEEEEKEKGRRL